jgi:dCTP deaminase
MILGDKAIKEYLSQGKGVISYKEEHINPNSVDLTLNPKMSVYSSHNLDCRQKNLVDCIEIPDCGFVLRPNIVYLVSTNESIDLKPMVFEKTMCSTGAKYGAIKHICAKVEGKSSLGRLGMLAHITAGWIDAGFKGSLVLELAVIQPLRIYPNMKICQVAFYECTEVETHYGEKEGSKYQNQVGAQESKMHENFK